MLVHNPADAAWFGQDRLLPDLERVHRPTTDPSALQLVADSTVPEGLAILDAPDVDSVEESNRALAAQLLAAADLWIFVTSAARYADQVPWDFLRQAADRSAAVAIVLDRTPPEAVDTVAAHLARMLASRGLKDSPLFTVIEGPVDDNGLLPAEVVSDISGWLVDLAADAEARAPSSGRRWRARSAPSPGVPTTWRTPSPSRSPRRSGCVRTPTAPTTAPSTTSSTPRPTAPCCAARCCRAGRSSSAPVSCCAGLETKVGWLRDRLVNAIKGKPQQAERVTVAVESGLETLILEHAESAAERAEASWQSLASGQALLADAGEDLGRASRDLRRKTERAVRDWQQDVLEMVRTEGADKRTTARFLAYGVNGLSVALMVVVFSHTAGLTGAEAGIAGGSAVLGQKLLEAVFGDQAVRSLAERARRSLVVRVRELVDAERARYVDLLDSLALDPQTPDQLR